MACPWNMRSMNEKSWRARTTGTVSGVAIASADRRGRVRADKRMGHTDRRRKYARILFPQSDEEWTPRFAYAVGLLATDGGLTGRKTVALVSKDKALVRTFLACIGATNPIGRNAKAFRVQIHDVAFYRWLESIGVTARKSLTLGPLSVPRVVFLDMVRGLFDGDGSIYTGKTVPNRRRYPGHVYQRLIVRFHSASEQHIQWLRAQIAAILGLSGWTTVQRKELDGRDSFLFVLRYSKHESSVLLPALYSDARSPRLRRKWRKWVAFRDHGMPTRTWTRRAIAPEPPRSEQATPTIDLAPE